MWTAQTGKVQTNSPIAVSIHKTYRSQNFSPQNLLTFNFISILEMTPKSRRFSHQSMNGTRHSQSHAVCARLTPVHLNARLAHGSVPRVSTYSWRCATCLGSLVEVRRMCKANADQRNNMLVGKGVNDAATVSVSGNQPSVAQEAQLMRSCRL